jgi:hypothetical protein
MVSAPGLVRSKAPNPGKIKINSKKSNGLCINDVMTKFMPSGNGSGINIRKLVLNNIILA